MSEDEPIREVAAPSQPHYEERAISESVVAIAAVVGSAGSLAGGAAMVVSTIHHWNDGQPPPEQPGVSAVEE